MILSIIIPTYNTRKITLNCLRSIFKYPPKESYEIIVLDNASRDKTSQAIARMFPKVHLIINKINYGYARANNQGVKIAKGKYILLLNSDVIIEKDNIQKMVEFLKTKKAAAAAAKLINLDGSTQYFYYRLFPNFMYFAASLMDNYLKIKTPLTEKYFMLDNKFDRESELEQAATSALIIKKSVISKISYLFDEKLPLFFNDTDLSKRIVKIGQKILLNPNVSIIHLRNQSTNQIDPFVTREELFVSLLYYFKKHGQLLDYLLSKISIVIFLIITILITKLGISNSYLGIKIKKKQNPFKKQFDIILSVILEKRHVSAFHSN